MFQKGRLGIVLALLLVVILTLTGCTNSAINKAVKNSNAFADEKNFEQAAQTLHSAESELGSNLGPKELKVLANAYSYIAIKITENAEIEAENGNFEKAYQDINYSYAVLNLPPTMSLSEEAIEAAHSARREIAKKCLKAVLELDIKSTSSQKELFNTASAGILPSITPEIKKMFDEARIKATKDLAITALKYYETNNNILLAEDTIMLVDYLATNISSAQSDKVIEVKNILQTRRIRDDIDGLVARAEQIPSEVGTEWHLQNILVARIHSAIGTIYNDPIYSKSITKEQKQRYNVIAIWSNNKIEEIKKSGRLQSSKSLDKYILSIFPSQ
jgi:hypothetical protein